MYTPEPPRPDRLAPAARATASSSDAADLLRADVAARLRPVCAAMTAEHFDRLVADVVAFTLRWWSYERGGAAPDRAD